MDKKLQIPHILQIGSSSWRDQVELPAGLGWHFFQVTALPSLKEYMEEEEISKFKALILENPEDLLALGLIKQNEKENSMTLLEIELYFQYFQLIII